jgi:cation diffusion facilitator family transporter
MHDGSKRAILAALLANLGIAIAKFVAFAFTGAASMLAEAIHSVADTGNQGLLFLGGARAKRPATAQHPFGYGRVRYFWAFIVALVLFTVGGLFAIYEGIEKLRHPHELVSPMWAVGVLGVAIILESLSFRTAIKEANAVRGRSGWWRFIRRSKTPELPVVLLEDLGALIGLVLALLGVGLSVVTGEPRFDAAGSLGIGILLVVIAAVLAVEMKSLLIGEAATPEVVSQIRAALETQDGVERIIHMRTQHMGPDELLVAAKVEFRADLGVAGLAAAIDGAEARMREAVPIAAHIYLEPDLFREG